jgi:hypothetical protein
MLFIYVSIFRYIHVYVFTSMTLFKALIPLLRFVREVIMSTYMHIFMYIYVRNTNTYICVTSMIMCKAFIPLLRFFREVLTCISDLFYTVNV